MPTIQELRSRLQRAVATARPSLEEQAAYDVAFHMTDWRAELHAFAMLCEHPEEHSDAQVDEVLTAFLCHAPNHIAAASKLYMDQPVVDAFGIGAVAETDDEA